MDLLGNSYDRGGFLSKARSFAAVKITLQMCLPTAYRFLKTPKESNFELFGTLKSTGD